MNQKKRYESVDVRKLEEQCKLWQEEFQKAEELLINGSLTTALIYDEKVFPSLTPNLRLALKRQLQLKEYASESPVLRELLSELDNKDNIFSAEKRIKELREENLTEIQVRERLKGLIEFAEKCRDNANQKGLEIYTRDITARGRLKEGTTLKQVERLCSLWTEEIAILKEELNRITLSPVEDEKFADKNIYKKSENRWLIIFNGRKLHGINNLIGMFYIKQFLKCKANDCLDPVELKNIQLRDVDFIRDGSSKDEFFKESYSPSGGFEDEILTRDARERCQNRLVNIEKEIKNAKKEKNRAKEQRLIEEKTFICRELKNSKYKGKNKYLQSEYDNAVRSIRLAVKRAIKVIKSTDEEAGKYFMDTIDLKDFKYIPSRNPLNITSWKFE
ncbi:MAG: hypothetical protein JXQ30_05360 [Spirochaetes bacterium]|nr:hypothetical protein [Spirochaetota bacterium]